MSNKLFILVSGGSRGLGLHIVEYLLGNGHSVASFARKRNNSVDKLAREYGETFSFWECDAENIKEISEHISKLVNRYGEWNVLINNAAIGQDHLLVHTEEGLIQKIINTNLTAPILLTRLALKYMLLQKNGGRIINISSICGQRGYAGLAAYSATKGGLDAFTRSLAREVSSRRVYVNTIAPGFFESEMSSVLSKEQIQSVIRRTPTQRLTNAHDILPLINFLITNELNITGQVLTVDGGLTS